MGKGTNIGPPGAHKQWWFNSKLQCWFICLIYYRSLVQSNIFCLELFRQNVVVSIWFFVSDTSFKTPLRNQTPQKFRFNFDIYFCFRVIIQKTVKRPNPTEEFPSQVTVCVWVRLQESPWPDQISKVRLGHQESWSASPVLEILVRQPAASCGCHIWYLWDRRKCCRMQGISLQKPFVCRMHATAH